jgi:aspartate/methionine/tyrosine aminotransferase
MAGLCTFCAIISQTHPDTLPQIDLLHLESLIDENTSAIVINNPSNPCGSVLDAVHLRQVSNKLDRLLAGTFFLNLTQAS